MGQVLRYFIVLAAAFILLMDTRDVRAVQMRNIEVLTPRSGQRGKKVTVIMQGMSIRDAREVLFYRPGIKAVAFENLPNRKTNIGLIHILL